MISRQKVRQCGILTILLVCICTNLGHLQAQQTRGFVSPHAPKNAPGLLQPAYMPGAASSPYQPIQHYPASPSMGYYGSHSQKDVMAIEQHSLFEYRRMYRRGVSPQPHELVGKWNGVNKGIVELVGYKQFIKDIRPDATGQLYGDNIQVTQVKPNRLRIDNTWQQKYDFRTKDYERRGAFGVQRPDGRGFFGHGSTFSYKDGDNPKNDPADLLVDQVVRIDDNHMLGRAVAKFGPFKIPLAYFVLERRYE